MKCDRVLTEILAIQLRNLPYAYLFIHLRIYLYSVPDRSKTEWHPFQ